MLIVKIDHKYLPLRPNRVANINIILRPNVLIKPDY